MIMNVNEISGFDAMAEEIRYVYAERDRLRNENEALRQFKTDICDVIVISKNAHNDTIIKALKADLSEAKRLRESVNKQEEFTEEAASILGVHPGDLSLSDILSALHKLKREEKLDDMNSSIIADLRTELDQSQRAFSGEHSRRLAAEKYISDTFQRAAKELGMTRIPDGIDRLCDEISDLRNYRNRISCPKEFWEAMCDVMEMAPTDATPSDVVGMTRETKQRLISILALNPDTATWTDIYKEIEKLKSWKTVAADHDKRRKNWVRKYKSEHERANSCDELYKKYKALYDAGAPAREKLSDNLQTYRSSYEAIKNVAVKNRSLMDTVAQIVGTVGMHDDVTMAGVLNVKKKANHWDVLVNGYGEGTMRSLLDNIGIDVSGDKGNGLFG